MNKLKSPCIKERANRHDGCRKECTDFLVYDICRIIAYEEYKKNEESTYAGQSYFYDRFHKNRKKYGR